MGSKGVTPIIATVILLMMTVAAAGAAYMWMNSLQSTIQRQVEETAGGVTGATQLMFDFKYKKCNATETGGAYGHNEIELIVENTGQGTIHEGPISLVLVDGEGNDLEFVENTGAMSGDFNVDTFLSINFNVTTDLVLGEEYTLRLSLPGNVVGSQFCVAR
jgi:flagellin-like protein